MTLEIPRTPTAQAVEALAREAAQGFLLAHSYRTFLFGAAVVVDRVDHEAAFVAAMVHDLGLTDRYRGEKDFGEVGSELAARFLEARRWERARVRLVQKAIVRHTRLVRERDPSVRLVQMGARIDVSGRGVSRLDPDLVARVHARFPRKDFAGQMRRVFLDEVQRQPRGSFARLEKTVGLSRRFAVNPLDSGEPSRN